LETYDFSINQRIVKIRNLLGYSQKVFSDDLKLSRSYLGGIEINQRKMSDRLIKMICLTYSIDENWVRTGEGEPFLPEKDPAMERIFRNYKKMDKKMQEYVVKYIDWLIEDGYKPL
jgi:transcriptional regulator with XRE-family HTH domain